MLNLDQGVTGFLRSRGKSIALKSRTSWLRAPATTETDSFGTWASAWLRLSPVPVHSRIVPRSPTSFASARPSAQALQRLRSADLGDDFPIVNGVPFGSASTAEPLFSHTGRSRKGAHAYANRTVSWPNGDRRRQMYAGSSRCPRGNRCYRIVTVGDFLMRFSRELWDFLRDTNLVPQRCAQIVLGCRSDVAHDSVLPLVDGQPRSAMTEDSIRLFPKAPAVSQPLRRSPDEPAIPASRRGFAAPRSEKPPP